MPTVNLIRPASGVPSPLWFVADQATAAPGSGPTARAPWTLSNYVDRVLFLLNQPADSDLAATYSGDGTPPGGVAPTVLSFAQVGELVNDCAAVLCRDAYPVADAGTLTVPAGWSQGALSAVSMTGGGQLWYVRAARFTAADGLTTRVLMPCDPGFADLFYPFGSPAGLPAYYLLLGTSEVGCAPAALTGGTLGLTGLVVPSPLSGGTDATGWLEPDLSWALAYGAAWRLCEARLDDDALAARLPALRAAWESALGDIRGRTRRADPAMAEALWGPEATR